MRQYISYNMEMMFVGSTGAFIEARNTGQYISRLDFIQSYGFSFNVERQGLKQIGSSGYATRQTQLAPDVELQMNYYLNDGWNEKYIGLDVNTASYSNPLSSILTNTGDRNFYVLISPDQGKDANAYLNVTDYNVLGIGNGYITNYEISVGVNQLATVSCSFVGANASITNYSSGQYMPSVDVAGTGQSAEGGNKKFGISFYDNSRSSRYITGFRDAFESGCSYAGCVINATPALSSGMKFGLDFRNFQNLSISVPFERKSLYGFGSNYPFTRKIQKPIMGKISLSSLVDTVSKENLASTFEAEDITISGYNFDIMFSNSKGTNKMGVKISNAKLDSYSIGSQIGDRSVIQTSWSFEITDTTGILMSGSCPTPTPNSIYINESINP